jgi:hypothetical protein
MTEEIRRTNVVGIAALRAANTAWRTRCTEAMRRHTAETLRLIRQHSITINLDPDKGSK